MSTAFWLLSLPFSSFLWLWICLLLDKTHLPLGGGCSACSGSQMTQLLSAEGAANKARHYTKKQNKSESEGWLRFWEKTHHTTARAPSLRERLLLTRRIAAKRKESSPRAAQPEHHHSENPCCPRITLQPKLQHSAFLTQRNPCWGRFIANAPRQNQQKQSQAKIPTQSTSGRIDTTRDILSQGRLYSWPWQHRTNGKCHTKSKKTPWGEFPLSSLSTAAMREVSSLSSEAI